MPQPDHISRLGVPDPADAGRRPPGHLEEVRGQAGLRAERLSATYSLRPQRLRNFMAMYNEIMLSESGLSKLEREMIAVVVSSANRCYYCLVAHGAAVRALSGDPELGEMMALNYRVAKLDARQRAMLDYAWKLTTTPWLIDDADRQRLREVGFSNEDIFDLSETVGLLQPVEPHGLGHRHDAEPGISPRGAVKPRAEPSISLSSAVRYGIHTSSAVSFRR